MSYSPMEFLSFHAKLTFHLLQKLKDAHLSGPLDSGMLRLFYVLPELRERDPKGCD